MGENKVLYIIIGALLAIIIGGAALFRAPWGKNSETSTQNQPAAVGSPSINSKLTPTAALTPTPTPPLLSEQPNEAEFNEYFSSINLAKMPARQKITGIDSLTETNVFSSGDQFCTEMMLNKTIPSGHLATAVYSPDTKKYVAPKMAFNHQLMQGGNTGCGNLTQKTGRYEYKIYVDSILVSVLPFEVK